MIGRRRTRDPSEHEAVFRRIYETAEWGSFESVSGPGSGLARTEDLRRELPALLAELGVRTLLDAGCGDFHWRQAAELPLRRYVGVEVVPELLAEVARRHERPGRRFVRADTGARWLLATTFVERPRNDPIELGGWRTLNLEAPPFRLPPPARLVLDLPLVDRELYLDKRLGLWELPDAVRAG